MMSKLIGILMMVILFIVITIVFILVYGFIATLIAYGVISCASAWMGLAAYLINR